MAAYLISLAENFFGVFIGMALFFAPFAGLFAYRERKQIAAVKPHFNYFMERFMVSRESNALIFTWAAAEAVVWYIIPEFLLFLVIFMKLHRKFDLVKFDLLGTVAGTLIAFWFHIPERIFLALPFVRPRMISQVHGWYGSGGIFGLLHQPFSGVPYKIFTHEAEAHHFFIPWFLFIAIAARMFRYLVVYQATVALYPLLHRFVRRHYAVLFLLATFIFSMLLTHVVQIYR